MPNEYIIKNGAFIQGNSQITGSLTVTAGVTGSFTGSFRGDGSQLGNLPTPSIDELQVTLLAQVFS